MRASVDAILVVREGGDRLGHTLRAVAAQSRPVNRVVIANTSADSTLSAQIETALQGLSLRIEILDLAYTMAMETFEKGAENRVVVLSDGDANVGNSSFDALLSQIKGSEDQ